MNGISVVIPVFNSESTLKDLLARLESVMAGERIAFEVVLVNDGSRDGSWNRICDLAASAPWILGINLMRNYGQHNALLCGIRLARYEVVITMDDDLQNPPEEIPKLLSKIGEGFDVVYGTPIHEQHGVLRDLASRITKLALQGAMGAKTARHVSAFRAFRTQLRDAFRQYSGPFVSIDVLLTWATTLFTSVPVQHDRRRAGVSNYTVGKLVRHALNMMTGFSIVPLQIASVIGFAFTLFGFSVLTYVIGRLLISGSSVPGFPFLASITAIFAGAQMFALGIIGEYLARMHFRMMERPPYAVRELADVGSVTKEDACQEAPESGGKVDKNDDALRATRLGFEVLWHEHR